MDKYTFADIIAANFQEIERNFRSGLKSKGYEYNRDLMNDAFISCNNALRDRKLTKQEAVKYYWTSYINKFKTFVSKQKRAPVPLPENYEQNDAQTYNPSVDEIYNIIISELCDKYGVRKTMLWEMYVCQGMTPKEIQELGFGKNVNFTYLVRQIKRYVHKHIIPNNERLKELIDCRRET